MFPILFQIGNFKVFSYGFFIAIGYLVAMFTCVRLAKKEPISPSHIIDVVFISLLTGLVGARVLFVITTWQYFKASPREVFYIWQGGLVFYGGLLVAIPSIFTFAHFKKIPLLPLLDVLSFGVVIGHAIGRIGCLAAGCCHGKACSLPWAIRLDTDLVDPSVRDIPVHPTQIYESLGLLILFFLLLQIRKRKHADGSIALAYLIGYSLLRSLIEIFRGDSIRGFLFFSWLSTSQFISAIIILVSLVLTWRLNRLRHNH